MYQKLNQNFRLKIALATLAIFMMGSFLAALPYTEIQTAQAFAGSNLLGSFFGGRVLSYTTPYPWTYGNLSGFCPGHVNILSYGGPYKGVLQLTVPPWAPKQWYQFFRSNVAIKGAYYIYHPMVHPSPLSCPSAPLMFPMSLGGTSLCPIGSTKLVEEIDPDTQVKRLACK